MAEKFFVECECGQLIRVGISDSGLSIDCPSCNNAVVVPNASKLREGIGDKNPMWSSIEKIQHAAKNHEPPFAGVCQVCNEADAEFATPVIFKALDARHVENIDSSVGSLLQVLGVGGTQREVERWQTTTFPFMLCRKCQSKFRAWRIGHFFRKLALFIPLTVLVIGSVYCSRNDRIITGIGLGGLAVVVMMLMFLSFVMPKRIDKSLLGMWLSNIRWLSEAVDAVGESGLRVGISGRIKND